MAIRDRISLSIPATVCAADRGSDRPLLLLPHRPCAPPTRSGPSRLLLALLTVTLWCQVPPASAWHEATDDIIRLQRLYDGIHILDGTYVMNVGQLQVNITNWGLIGSRFTEISTYSDAPSAQWPAGSSVEYMWAAGLWVGGRLHGDMRVSTGQFEAELRTG